METGESGTRPDTISEESGLSYGGGRGGVAGGLIMDENIYHLPGLVRIGQAVALLRVA